MQITPPFFAPYRQKKEDFFMSEKKVGKRLLTWVLVLVMTLSLLPLNVLAENSISPASILPPDTKCIVYTFYNGDVVVDKQEIKDNESLKVPATPEEEGYQFTGWFYQNGTEFTDFGTAIHVTEGSTDVNLYARFVPVCYVYFMDGKGTDARIIATKEVTEERPLTDFSDVSFVVGPDEAITGWVDKDNNPVTMVSFSDGTTYLYPVVEKGYWITFESDGGSYVEPLFVPKGKNYAAPTAPTKPGYDFDGWYNGETAFTFGSSLTEDLTLTAHWTEKANVQYTVIHRLENADDNNYSYKESETKTGTAGAQTNATAKDTKRVEDYKGFTAQTITQETINGDGSTIVNVYYKRNKYTITFYLDDPIYTCGKEAHTHSGWDALGGCYDWNRKLTCTKEEHSHNSSCKTSTLTITAKYGANISNQWPTVNGSSTWRTKESFGLLESPTYQVNIDTMPLDGANFYGPKTGHGSETAYYYVESLSGANYELHHKDTSPGSNSKVSEEDKYPITGFTYKEGTRNGSRYNEAKFYYTRNSYDIVYVNTGAEDDKTVSYKFEAPISDAGNYEPTTTPAGKDGYIFDGWYDAPTGGSRFDFANKIMPAQNITVYAKWKAPTFTVTVYDVDKETKLKTFENVSLRGTINKADMPTVNLADGDTFLGWTYKDGTPFNFNTAITKNINLYARVGNKAGYSVTYVTEGSSPVTDDKLYAEGAYATVRNGPSTAPAGKVFLYWNASSGKKYPNDKVLVPKGGVTLTAVYGPVAQVLTLTYHSNYPDGTDTTALESNLKNNARITVAASNKFSPPIGYEFDCWNTKADGTGDKFAAGSSARVDNIDSNDLYAQWKLTQITDKVTVTIKGKTSTATYDGQPHTVNGYDIVSITGNDGYTENDFTFSGTAEAKGTDAGTYDMGLNAKQFTNTNTNFTSVTFVISTDGKLEIKPRNVTLTSASDEKVYDGTPLTKPDVTVGGNGFVEGEVSNITATGSVTNVSEGEIDNTIVYTTGAKFNANNYNIQKTEGKLKITPVTDEITVTITGNTKTVMYNGSEQSVSGYTTDVDGKTISVALKEGSKAEAKGINVGKYDMHLTAADFTVSSTNYSNIKVVVNDGYLEITPITETATVTITGNHNSVKYNGREQSVTGFTYTAPEGVTVALRDSFKAEAKGTNVGTYKMDLTSEYFTVTSNIYEEFKIVVNDGYLEITRSGGHHPRPKPTVEIEDDDALGLNTTDHFAYIVGYGNGEVRPQNNITRAEVATIFFRLLTDDVRDENLTKTNRYSDVAATSWYNTAVSTLSSMGIITGYPDGTFRPNAAITRAEFAAIAARFDTNGDKTTAKFSDIATHWARDEISIAYNNGWITGYPDGTFGPQRDITRAETMTLVNRVLNRQPETEEDLLPNMTVWTDNADPNAWYYLAVQEATNSHYYKFKTNSQYEKWTELRETRDWTLLEK